MTLPAADNTIKEKLRNLQKQLADKQELPAQEDVVEYNWLEPHLFNTDQKKSIDQFCGQLATHLTTELGLFLKSDIEVTFDRASVYFSQYLADQLNAASNDRISYGLVNTNTTEAMFTMSKDSAATLLTPVMGTIENEEFSSLELSILQDLLEGLSTVTVQTLPGLTIHQPASFVSGELTLELPSWQEVLKIELSANDLDTETPIKLDLIISCDKLGQLTGNNAALKEVSPDDIEQSLIACLGEHKAGLVCEITKQTVTINELMNLEANDILILDKNIYSPVTINLNHTSVFEARPAVSEKHYAAVILKTIKETEAENTE